MVLKSTCPSWESAWNILLLFLSYNLKLRLEMEPVFVYQKYYSVAPDFLRKKPGEKSTCWSVFGEKLAILGIILAKSWRFGAETGEKLAIFKGKIFSFGSNFGDFRGKNWRNSTSTFWQHWKNPIFSKVKYESESENLKMTKANPVKSSQSMLFMSIHHANLGRPGRAWLTAASWSELNNRGDECPLGVVLQRDFRGEICSLSRLSWPWTATVRTAFNATTCLGPAGNSCPCPEWMMAEQNLETSST